MGDKSAGQELFARYYDLVARFFVNKVGDASADLIQRTFLSCVEGCRGFVTMAVSAATCSASPTGRGREQLRATVERLAASPDLARSTIQGLETWARDVRAQAGR